MRSKILIVEDQFIEANNFRQMLVVAGYQVCPIARSVEEAASVLELERPGFVLLDVTLKGERKGLELAPLLQSRQIPFIYLTANSDEQTFVIAKKTGPYGLLVKPVREKDVLAMLSIVADLHREHLSLAKLAVGQPVMSGPVSAGKDDFGMVGERAGLKEVSRLVGIAAGAEAGWRCGHEAGEECPGGAAELLRINASTLKSRMVKLGIQKQFG